MGAGASASLPELQAHTRVDRPQAQRLAGASWDEDEWDRVQENGTISADQWHAAVAKAKEHLRRKTLAVAEVKVDPNAYWCVFILPLF